MKKILFNNGGQPTYLDDIETLQDVVFATTKGIVDGLAGEGVYLVDKPELRPLAGNNYWYIVSPTRVLVNGQVVIATGTAGFKLSNLYLHVYERDVDERVLANGTTAPCAKETVAEWVKDPADASGMYSALGMKTIRQAVAEQMYEDDTRDVSDFAMFNGYHGTIKRQEMGNIIRYIVNLESEQTSWSSNHVFTIFSTDRWICCPVFKSGDDMATLYNGSAGDIHISGPTTALAGSPSTHPIHVVFDVVQTI